MKLNLSPYLNLNRLEFVVTHQCSGKCKHCSVGAQINQNASEKHVLADKAVKAVETLSALFPITSVMTFGGEPLLYPEVTCAIHAKAAQCGIGARQIITNGFFTKDPEKCSHVVHDLKHAGVNNLLLSVDAFHQETIPVEQVYSFAKNAVDAGIENMKLHPAWVVNREHENPYNSKTKVLLAGFADLGIPVSSGNNIFMAGNAKQYLVQYYDMPSLDLSGRCGTMPYTSPLTDISSLSIVPNGDVMICSFVIGNIYAEEITDIISRYNPYSNNIMRSALTGGIPALLDFAQHAAIPVDTAQCGSICDVCHSIVKAFSSDAS